MNGSKRVITVICFLQFARACGAVLKPFSLRRRSLARETPVLRPSSARFIFSKEKHSPSSDFISSMACVILTSKPLSFAFIILLPLSCCPTPVYWIITHLKMAFSLFELGVAILAEPYKVKLAELQQANAVWRNFCQKDCQVSIKV